MTIRITDPAEDRYQRLRLIRWWDQQKLSESRVLVAGAGALGNEVIKNLALLGAGAIYIVDFDDIETSNLTRSALFRACDVGRSKAEVASERASEINPDCKLHPLRIDVRHDLGFFFLSQMDLIFACLDNREARYYLNRYSYLLRKTMIDAGLDTLNGSVTVFAPPETACYECTLGATDRMELQKRISCLKSLEPEIKHHTPTAPTIASITGGLQAQIGVRALHGLQIPAGRRIGLYGLSDVFFEIEFEISNDCGLHAAVDPLPEDIALLPVSEHDSLEVVLAAANQEWQATGLVWDFDRDLVTGLCCTACGKTREISPTTGKQKVDAQCECGGIWKPETVSAYSGTEPWGTLNFRQLGFPPSHIFCAQTPSGRVYFRCRETEGAGETSTLK